MAEATAVRPPDSLCEAQCAEHIFHDWLRVGMGIVLAGSSYPLVLALFGTIARTVYFVVRAVSGHPVGTMLGDTLVGLAMLEIFAIGGALIGMAWSGLVTALTLPVLYLFLWSLGIRVGMVWRGAFAGGLVGCIAAALFLIGVPWAFVPDSIGEAAIMIILGPGLTTILGQIGGA